MGEFKKNLSTNQNTRVYKIWIVTQHLPGPGPLFVPWCNFLSCSDTLAKLAIEHKFILNSYEKHKQMILGQQMVEEAGLQSNQVST